MDKIVGTNSHLWLFTITRNKVSREIQTTRAQPLPKLAWQAFEGKDQPRRLLFQHLHLHLPEGTRRVFASPHGMLTIRLRSRTICSFLTGSYIVPDQRTELNEDKFFLFVFIFFFLRKGM